MASVLPPGSSRRALMSLSLLIAATSCAGEENRPQVDISLTQEVFYVREVPTLRLAVTAPRGRAVTVVNTDRVRTRCCLVGQITSPEGRTAWCFVEPHLHPVYAHGDFSELPPGQQRLMEFEVPHVWVATPGKYRMQLQFTPTPDPNYVVRRELTVTYRGIPPEDVLWQFRIPIPRNPHHANQEDLGFASFMNVKTDRGCELFFYEEKGALNRVLPLDPDSKLTVLPKYFNQNTFDQEYWVVFNQGGKLQLAQLTRTGSLLRTTVIDVPRFGNEKKGT